MDSGVRDALIDAWKHHRRRLLVLCRRWAGGTHADAEDIVSHVIVKALEEAAGGAVVVSYPAWLMSIAWNLCIDLHRQRARVRRALDLVAYRSATEEQAARSPEALHLQSELGECLRKAMDELPSLLGDPCKQRFLEDTPYEQIAAELGINNDTARKRIQEARAILKARVGAYQRDGVMGAQKRPRRPPRCKERNRASGL
ncbi:RNA polymerase, sigma-24 subunit, ECF subfamily protein [Minicystis rosea]|nr:RNA polymerase, sigma-24 subunit, ECF subfamily protein [Minicystis rosea]